MKKLSVTNRAGLDFGICNAKMLIRLSFVTETLIRIYLTCSISFSLSFFSFDSEFHLGRYCLFSRDGLRTSSVTLT